MPTDHSVSIGESWWLQASGYPVSWGKTMYVLCIYIYSMYIYVTMYNIYIVYLCNNIIYIYIFMYIRYIYICLYVYNMYIHIDTQSAVGPVGDC